MQVSAIDYDRTAIDYRNERYLCVRNLLPRSLVEYLQVYYRILSAGSGFHKDEQCPLSWSVGGDPAFDALLAWIAPEVSRLVGFDVVPTYSYARIYAKGDVLARHSDRAACEISVSVAIEIPQGAAPSMLWLKPPNHPATTVEMSEGDGCIYAGPEVDHWREPIPADGYMQLFLHFIDRRGEHFPELAYDRRKCLGAPYVARRPQGQIGALIPSGG
jgi:hypothetical protein